MSEAGKMAVQMTCENCQGLFASRNQLFKHLRLCKGNQVLTTGVKRKCDNDSVSTTFPSSSACNELIKIASENEWYRVIIKPQGMASMGTSSESKEETLMNTDQMLLENAVALQLTYKKAVPCHRLDRATGGLMLCSKTKEAESRIMACFREHTVLKRYRAIVKGKLEPNEGTIDTPVSEQSALTKYKVISHTRSYQYGWITTIDLWPITGRRHQLRKHMAGLGHYILGDTRYSSALDYPDSPYHDVLFLWAVEISFPDIYSIASTSLDSSTTASAEAATNETSVTSTITVSIDEPVYYEEFRQCQDVDM